MHRPEASVPALACDSHMHIFDRRFAPSPHWPKKPPEATVADYRRLQERLGTARAVIVTPSTYAVDNRCTLDALASLGGAARGVAVVAQDVDAAELDRLHAHGVRGVRVNFVSPQAWGPTTPEMVSTLAGKIAPLGWHVQVFLHPEQLAQMEGMLSHLPVPLVIDHLALLEPASAFESPAYAVLRRLLDGGNTWVKLSGAYMISRAGEPAYEDTVPLGRALVAAAPERLVWGSDWPHATQEQGTVDDANLLDLLQAWCDSEKRMERILVRNPAVLYQFDGA